MDTLLGNRLGNYHIHARLGQGGMGTVYKATHVTRHYTVALKVLAPYLSNDSSFVRRFQEEYRTVRGLIHRNIVRVYEFGWAQGYYYIASEYIAGLSLAERMKRKSVLSVRDTVRIITQIGMALDAAHQRGIVHRDLKPSNVLLEAKGRVLLTDFGIASVWYRQHQLQSTGQISGTLDYMAPEQARGESQIGHHADIYALGVIAYQMLTGHLPIERGNPWAMLHAKAYGQPQPLHTYRGGRRVSTAVETIIMQALSNQPERRPDRAGRFAGQLAEGAGITLHEHRTMERLPLSTWKLSNRVFVAGVLLLLSFILLVMVLLQTGEGTFQATDSSFPSGTLAYVCGEGNGNLCIQSEMGEREILTLVQQGWTPAWSPDGRYLAYAAINEDEVDIWIYDSVSQTVEVITDYFSGDAWSPSWSPDSTRLVFDVERGGNTDIYMLTLGETEAQRLTWSSSLDSDPAWSPDGAKLAFVSDRSDDLELYLITENGKNLRRLTTHPGRDFAPTWSPDSRYLAYECADVPEDDVEICLFDFTTNAYQSLTRNDVEDRQPAWTPDGQYITFVQQRAGDAWDIWIMDPQGQGVRPLVQDRFSSTHPTWKR